MRIKMAKMYTPVPEKDDEKYEKRV